MPPKVSICLPNLNTRPFLPERFESIFNQTFKDWELIVCDSFSNDGSWEYIQELAAKEPRMRIYQTPKNGIYAGFNDTIKLATGDYVYIATSDDSMMPECLEKMVAALERHTECGLCHCQLVIINEKSEPFPEERQWHTYTLGLFDKEIVLKGNKRLAPYDALLNTALFTIHTSVTQLLIRRAVFDRVGLFDGQWGSIGDFEWEMRASFLESCVYIPDRLATWRIHASQATQNSYTAAMRTKMIDIIHTAFTRAKRIDATGLTHIRPRDLIYFIERDCVEKEVKEILNYRRKFFYLLKQMPKRAHVVLDMIKDRRQGKTWDTWFCSNRYSRLRDLLNKYKMPPPTWTE